MAFTNTRNFRPPVQDPGPYGGEGLPIGEQHYAPPIGPGGTPNIPPSMGNKPVSMACWGRASDQGVSINTVFTPTQYRGLGHGTKVTGHLCQMLLERFPKCFLYVDKAQSHTAEMYEKLGFKHIVDSLDVKIKQD